MFFKRFGTSAAIGSLGNICVGFEISNLLHLEVLQFIFWVNYAFNYLLRLVPKFLTIKSVNFLSVNF